jgi:Lrp/AsnC family transcriptional regulator for asnA, asnC and gidA
LSKFDQLDHDIITLLNRNARSSSAEIARELGTAERSVRNRIRRLIENKVIAPVAVVNPAAFGYTLWVDIFCEVDPNEQDQAIEALVKMPEVAYIAYSTGDQDISLQAVLKNSEDMHEFLTQRLHQVPGLRRTRTVLIPRVVKDTYQWLPPNDSIDVSNSGRE